MTKRIVRVTRLERANLLRPRQTLYQIELHPDEVETRIEKIKPFGSVVSTVSPPPIKLGEQDLNLHVLSDNGFTIVILYSILDLVHERGLEPPRDFSQ